MLFNFLIIRRWAAALVSRAGRSRIALLTLATLLIGSTAAVLTQEQICSVVVDSQMRTPPSVPKPGYLDSFTDPTFGSSVTRITGDPGTPIPGIGGTWGSITRHNYAKDPVWNADQSLLLLKSVQGASGHMFLDGTTYQPQFLRSGPGGETRWHPSQPDLMTFVRTNCSVGHWNVRTNTSTVLFSGTGYSNCYLGPWEGNTSADGRWLAISATRSSDGRAVAFAVDLQGPTKYADIDLVSNGITDLDWVSISASGTYVVANGTITGCATVGGDCDATKVFTRSGTQVGPFWSEYGRPSHYDLTLDVDGNDVAVGVAKTAPNEGKVMMRRLSDGVVTVLNAGGYSQHHSTRNTARPGWAYVSHPYNGPYWPPYRNEVFAVKLDGSLTVERVAHLQATTPTYEAQPQIVPSPDGRRVLFASNWNISSGPVQAYVADIRPLCGGSEPAPTCTYALETTIQSASSAGGSQSVALNTSAGCSWTATTGTTWITITNTDQRTGSGTVNYTVAANASTSARTGTMMIGGQTLTVTQAGAAPTEEPPPSGGDADLIAQFLNPTDGASGIDLQPHFQWTTIERASRYRLYVGTTPGAKDLADSGITTQTSFQVTKALPSGRRIYARLRTRAGTTWRSTDISFVTK